MYWTAEKAKETEMALTEKQVIVASGLYPHLDDEELVLEHKRCDKAVFRPAMTLFITFFLFPVSIVLADVLGGTEGRAIYAGMTFRALAAFSFVMFIISLFLTRMASVERDRYKHELERRGVSVNETAEKTAE